MPLFRAPPDGWCTRVELTALAKARHHQIRRLCARANLKLLHLKRLSVGPISLEQLSNSTTTPGADGMRPGEVRELRREEKRELYAASLPRLLSGEASRDLHREIEWEETW